jgi:hypothetical protein
MIPKKISDISISDITSLISDGVNEGKTIEYKAQFPGHSDSDKISFLAGISAFANSIGGDFIIGVEATDGIPLKAMGIEIANPDQEILRIEQIIRNGVEPRIPRIETKIIPIQDKFVLIVRVHQSWISPHRVSLKDHSKFYARNSKGKYPMDVSELRVAFVGSETISDRIKQFKNNRMAKIIANDAPVPTQDMGKLVLHYVPLHSFMKTGEYISMDRINKHKLPPLGSKGYAHKVNIDGLVTYSKGSENFSDSYCQFFRNGVLETVNTLTPFHQELIIPSEAYEQEILASTKDYFLNFEALEIPTPIFVFLSFINVKKYRFAVSQRSMWADEGGFSDRDIIEIPEFIIEDLKVDLPTFFRPLFDFVWNAFGYQRSNNYNAEGKWVGQR